MITLKTNHGDIVIELDEQNAPVTAANFKQYVEDGFYDGTIFHRVIGNFMIQGGGMTPDMVQKATRPAIENEAKNGLKNARGSIAMARTGDPHSATAQFFINVKDNDFLDYPGQDGWGYCVFGKVVEGMDVVDRIKAVATATRRGHQDVPVEDVVIEQATVG
jgi:peptidyl-prolyl cis-trans isomerase B (cyclophilin B)